MCSNNENGPFHVQCLALFKSFSSARVASGQVHKDAKSLLVSRGNVGRVKCFSERKSLEEEGNSSRLGTSSSTTTTVFSILRMANLLYLIPKWLPF